MKMMFWRTAQSTFPMNDTMRRRVFDLSRISQENPFPIAYSKMSRIDAILTRLESFLDLPVYDGVPLFIEHAFAQSGGNVLPRLEVFAEHIANLSVQSSESKMRHAVERAHVLRSACSHLHTILKCKSLSSTLTKHMDCLSVIVVAMEKRQEKDWDDAENLRLSSRKTIDELTSAGLCMEEIYGDDQINEELRTLREFCASKLESHSVWKLLARVVSNYLASARAFAYYLRLGEIIAGDLRQQEMGLRLAARFRIDDLRVLREDLQVFMHKCKTLTYLDPSCLPVGVDAARWREVACDMVHGLSGRIYIGNRVIIEVSTGPASTASAGMKVEETGIMKHIFDLTFHVDGANELRIDTDSCPAITEFLRGHTNATDCGDWYVNETRIRQRVRADVRRHSKGCRDIVISVTDRGKEFIIVFMVQIREEGGVYVIEYGFQDPLGQRKNVVRWPSRSFL